MTPGATPAGRPVERDAIAGVVPAAGGSNISVYALLNALLRERRLILGTIALTTLLGLAIGLLLPRQWAATSSLVTQTESGNAGQLAGLAAQFGVAVPSVGKGDSPEFYAALLQSRELLQRVIQTEYSVARPGGAPGDSVRGNLIVHLGLADAPRDKQMKLAVRKLSQRVSARADLRTNIVRLVAVANSPQLAEAINARLLELLGEFNLATRQSQAHAERQFVQERVADAGRELRGAEARLQAFLSQNRRIDDSPQLTFERARLERDVSLRQQVFEGLSRSLEDARIEEVRATPVVTIIDRPAGSAERTGVGRAGAAIIGLATGILLALALALTRQYLVRREAVEEQAYEEFVELRGELAHTLQPSRWFGARGSREQRTH